MARAPKVRLWIGTRKGGYIAESDNRRRWAVRGPFHPGRDVFHVVEDPRSPGTAYAAVNSGFLGPILAATRDGGHHWSELALPRIRPHGGNPKGKAGRKIVNLWHITPGPPEEPATLFLGIDPATIFRSDNRGKSWVSLEGLNDHPSRTLWNPGAGGMCLHSIEIDPTNSKRMYAGISAAGTFRSDDGGERWRPMNNGVLVSFLPTPKIEVGQCVHHIALDPADPATIYRQDHDGIYVTHDRMEHWKRAGKPLPSDFGFVVATHPSWPGSAFFVPLHGEGRVTMDGGLQIYRWDDRPGRWKKLIAPGAFPGEYGTHREGLAADRLDPAGIYLGTTTGELVYTADGGGHWSQIPYQFPTIHSVTAASSDAG